MPQLRIAAGPNLAHDFAPDDIRWQRPVYVDRFLAEHRNIEYARIEQRGRPHSSADADRMRAQELLVRQAARLVVFCGVAAGELGAAGGQQVLRGFYAPAIAV